jgi:hypoxanthine phosphoribosyltransferase
MLSTPEILRRTGGRPVKSIVFDEAAIAAKVQELGAEITDAYPDGELLVLGLLKGSFIFLSDLVRTIERPIQVDFLVASSYGDAKVSSGQVRLLYDPETRLEGKHILLVEDIIDTGKTLQRLMTLLGARRPRSLAICALLDKQIAVEVRPELRFVHAENYRHLPFIADLE